jgi:transcriptional regulator with XRE-family HTH domain
MQTELTPLARWLQAELDKRSLSQVNAAAAIGVGTGTISEIIRRGHIPKIDTLFRIADYFDTPRDKVVRLAANLPPPGVKSTSRLKDDYLIEELVDAFRQIPDQFKPDVLQQLQLMVRLANQPPARFIGDEEPNPEPQEPADDDEENQETQAA